MAIFSQAQNGNDFKCTIKGKVIERPESKELYLTKMNGDFRVDCIRIPIQNATFEYELITPYQECYELTFVDEAQNGSWRPIYFIAEPGLVEMTLYPMDQHHENIVQGGTLNQIYSRFQKEKNTSFDFIALDTKREALPNRGLTETANDLWQKITAEENQQEKDKLYSQFEPLIKSKEAFTEEYNNLEKEYLQLIKDSEEWEEAYAKDSISIYGYTILIEKIRRAADRKSPKFDEYINIANIAYIPKYPNHPYTKEVKTILNTHTEIRIGGKYIDFTLPDFDGNMITLSDQIKGKVALIDLWASWCGPCRRLSKSMIPIYEEYKDKGFDIIGVAREEKKEDAINAAQKDKYPWINLLELKDAAGIWKMYGIGNAGGSTFLVDKDGTILTIHPSAEEVQKILEDKLK
ncbi:MAG: TlpA disulfide reductase family protein [Dysgonomonas sp.]|nr:TlpA disulfide reductase family protein [Dysgonomonas sp.]